MPFPFIKLYHYIPKLINMKMMFCKCIKGEKSGAERNTQKWWTMLGAKLMFVFTFRTSTSVREICFMNSMHRQWVFNVVPLKAADKSWKSILKLNSDHKYLLKVKYLIKHQLKYQITVKNNLQLNYFYSFILN